MKRGFCLGTSPALSSPVSVEQKQRANYTRILIVLTSHDQLGNTGRKTGFWLEEFAAPYFVFRDAGVALTLASPKGGQPPIDPKSDLPENQTPAMARFKQDAVAQKALASTVKLADVKAEDYDTVFYPGGHTPCGISRRAPPLRFARIVLQLRPTNRFGLPFAWGASACYIQGCSACERKARNGLYEWRGRRGAAYQGGAIPG